ncbi:NUC domain-containing protein [Trichostrongylus colubriformis]|uniref:NUC domain-containing protein n=1 Tax=Trichostrongylus colubriformis TaxID=6319 RepID=A0AAN8EWU9_TRICO
MRIFTPLSAPTRWHYSGLQDAADLLLVAQSGTELCRNCGGQLSRAVVLGSDYQDQQMHAIFYAQGPSMRSSVTVPSFQNIELMNLWTELLQLEHVQNNGSKTFPEQILREPRSRVERRKFGIRECPFTNEESVIDCGGCSMLQRVRLTKWMLTCNQPNRHLIMLSTSFSSLCYQKFCEKLVITGTIEDDSVALLEIFHKNNTVTSSQSVCRFVNSRYDDQCPIVNVSEDQGIRTLSANPKKVLARMATIQIPWNVLFIRDVLDHANAYTLAVSKKLGRVICLTGTAFDRNFDGIADKNKTGSPSHMYRVLIRCSSPWSADGFSCQNPLRAEVLAFIFPHMEGDANGLAPHELLLLYTARLRDVELISGIEFDLPMVPAMHMMRLKLNVATQLW